MPTRYVVLVQLPDGGWREERRGEAGSAASAIRRVAESMKDGTQTFVAVPERSFEPLTVSVAQVPKMSVTAASKGAAA